MYSSTLLYDFYGELLTEHQRRIYVGMSCSMTTHLVKWQQIWESADRACMTTSNAVIRFFQTMKKNCISVEKYVNIPEKIHRIHGLAKNCESISKEELVSEVEHISQEILEEL